MVVSVVRVVRVIASRGAVGAVGGPSRVGGGLALGADSAVRRFVLLDLIFPRAGGARDAGAVGVLVAGSRVGWAPATSDARDARRLGREGGGVGFGELARVARNAS